MQAANHVKFGRAFAHALLGALVNLFESERVRAGSIRIAAERAELAMRDAHVGRIDVAIDVEETGIAVTLLANGIREPAEGEQVGRAVERDAILKIQALASEDFVGYRFHPFFADSKFTHG